MVAQDSAPVGAPCWVDLMTSDTTRARAFYEGVLGWQALEANEEFGGYFMFMNDGVPVAGAMANHSEGAIPDLWSVYLRVDDAEAALSRATQLGGHVMVPAMRVGDLGTMAVIADPVGAGIGIWAPIDFQGFGAVAEPGTPVWFELHTSDYDVAIDYYRDVFDWTTEVMSATPEFRYSVSKHGESSVAGVYDARVDLGDAGCSFWTVYFGVEDVDDALRAVGALGGSVVSPAANTPYGRMATVADPTGTEFRIMQELGDIVAS